MKILLPVWLGSYFGCDFELQTYERLSIDRFGIAKNTSESLAFKHRWFDYRRLHPLQCTYYLAKLYSSMYTNYTKKYFGIERKFGVKHQDFLKSREATSFNNLRRYCDLNGYEYKWFMNAMMEFRLSTGFKNRIPRPSHLIPKGDEEEAIKELWKLYIGGDVLLKAVDPFYLISNWRGDENQIEYENFLVSQVAKKRVKRFALSDLVYNQRCLRIEAVANNFPEELRDVLR